MEYFYGDGHSTCHLQSHFRDSPLLFITVPALVVVLWFGMLYCYSFRQLTLLLFWIVVCARWCVVKYCSTRETVDEDFNRTIRMFAIKQALKHCLVASACIGVFNIIITTALVPHGGVADLRRKNMDMVWWIHAAIVYGFILCAVNVVFLLYFVYAALMHCYLFPHSIYTWVGLRMFVDYYKVTYAMFISLLVILSVQWLDLRLFQVNDFEEIPFSYFQLGVRYLFVEICLIVCESVVLHYDVILSDYLFREMKSRSLDHDEWLSTAGYRFHPPVRVVWDLFVSGFPFPFVLFCVMCGNMFVAAYFHDINKIVANISTLLCCILFLVLFFFVLLYQDKLAESDRVLFIRTCVAELESQEKHSVTLWYVNLHILPIRMLRAVKSAEAWLSSSLTKWHLWPTHLHPLHPQHRLTWRWFPHVYHQFDCAQPGCENEGLGGAWYCRYCNVFFHNSPVCMGLLSQPIP